MPHLNVMLIAMVVVLKRIADWKEEDGLKGGGLNAVARVVANFD